MEDTKRANLEAAGWKVGGVDEYLGLTPGEMALIELKIALAGFLRAERERAGVTQTELANRIGSSQSRVAKMEAGDPSVSLDLLIRALLAVGASRREVGQALARRVA